MNVELSITEQCNLRCSYCYFRESHAGRCAVMSEEVMEASIRLALKRAIELGDAFFNVTFFGGEPLLRMDFIKKTVKFTRVLVKQNEKKLDKSFRLHFSIDTNGTLLTDDIIRYLKREKIRVTISLDGPEKKHDISRLSLDGKGSFRKIKPFIPALVEMGAEVACVITQRHIKGLADSIKWFFKQGFKNVNVAQDFNESLLQKIKAKAKGEFTDDLLDFNPQNWSFYE